MAILYIVATPIGNLEDISVRGLKILKSVDLILCEDTRVTRKLLARYEIKTPTISYHQHSKLKRMLYILNLLKQGKNLALVSDAGTPGISDPGSKLISQILRNNQKDAVRISPIPGPSALIAAASICGFPMDKFVFMGFPPAKKKRKKFFQEVLNSKYPVIFYESPYRILKTLNELKNMFQVSRLAEDGESRRAGFKFQAVVCRELTKKFETIYQEEIEEVIKKLEKEENRGEFTVIVKP